MSLEQVIKRQKEIKGTLESIDRAKYNQGSCEKVHLHVHNNTETVVQHLSGPRFNAFLINEKVFLEEELAVINNALTNANIFVQGFMKGEEPPVAIKPEVSRSARKTPNVPPISEENW